MKTTNTKELLAIATTTPVLLAEYRSGGTEAEVIRWRDKQTGTAQTAEVRNYNFECGPTLVRVQLPRDIKPEETLGLSTPLDLTKGTTYLVRVRQAAMNRGVLSVTGTIHPFSAEGPAAR